MPALPYGPSVLFLAATNLVPLAGVLAFGWGLFPVMLIYWAENVVIGLLNAARMLMVRPGDARSNMARVVAIPFFLFHYGFFTAGHGIFLLALFGGGRPFDAGLFDVYPRLFRILLDEGLLLPLAGLVLSHAFSFFVNFIGRKEYLRQDLKSLMGRPYGRIVVLHVTLIAGGIATQAMQQPVAALAILVVLKTVLDIRGHRRDHAA